MVEHPRYVRSSTEDAISTCLGLRPAVLILDAEPLLIDWSAPDGAWNSRWHEVLSRAVDQGVGAVVVVTNSRRDLSGLIQPLPDRGTSVRLVRRARKPWTTRRTLGLSAAAGSGVVCGDVSLTDGLLATRLGFTFVHVQAEDPPPLARLQNRCGRLLALVVGSRQFPGWRG
ncbi:hypothetical protein GCM10010522_29770 [Kribbella solani]